MAHKINICAKCHSINKIAGEKLSGNAVCGKCGAELDPKIGALSISGEKLMKVIKHSSLPVVVDVYADWCGPCQMYGPIFKEVSEKNWQRAEFFKLDSEANQQFAAQFGIRGIPATLVFQNGQLVKNQPGLLNHAQLEGLF